MKLLETVNGLAEILNEKDLGCVSIKADDIEIYIEAKQPAQIAYTAAPAAISAPVTEAAAVAIPTAVPEAAKSGNYIKSPIVGTFYSAPAPEKPPFVKVGDTVTKGQVVCIIESMKLMNEITSEFDGTVAAVLVDDGEAVDFGKELIQVT